jgi:phosphatidylinositol alpha-mannosyltransferase
LLALQYSKAKNVATFHAGHRKSIGYFVFKPWLSSYFRKFDGLIAVSEAAEVSMSKYFRGNYRIIPNGVDTEGFHPNVKPIPRFIDSRKKILYMNRLEPKKGLPHLVKALRLIKKEIPDVLAIVAGSGPFEGYYRAMVDASIADNVIFVGAVPALPISLRASYYRTCDLYCAPSIGHESFGIVLLEAMACQKPLIASHIDGYKEVLEHRKEGLFFKRKDDESLAAAALKILKDPELAEKMGRAGRIKALQHSWPRVARQVEEFYHEILAS